MHYTLIGSLNSLYHSLGALDDNCLLEHEYKEMLLHPRNMAEDFCNTLKVNVDDTPPKKYFVCSDYRFYCCTALISCTLNFNCRCGKPINGTIFLESSANGFVNDDVSYIIIDDLIVIPNSVYYSSFAHIQNSGIKGSSSLKKITMKFTKKKVLHLHLSFLNGYFFRSLTLRIPYSNFTF